MGSGDRASKRGRQGDPLHAKIAGMTGKCRNKALVEMYNTVVIGLNVIFDYADDGDPEAVRAIVSLAEQAVQSGGHCQGAALRVSGGRRRRGKS